LLLGGRIADYVGRKRSLLVGLIGFAAASALGGVAPSADVLIGARALQGAFAALLAPAALSLLSVTFTDPAERAKAFAVYGAIGGGGVAIGLLGGGVLTQYLSWRWCLLVNTPIAIATATGAILVIRESRAAERGRYDLPGALSSTLGLVCLVYGFTQADAKGWGAAETVVLLALAVVLLVAFVVIERRSPHPLLPLHIVTERNRGGAFVTSMLASMANFSMFLFMTYFLQGTLRYSPVKTGFAFLPLSVGIVASAGVASQLMKRMSPRWIMAAGLAFVAVGMLLFTRLEVNSSYWPDVFPGMAIMSIGLGLVFVPLFATFLYGVNDSDSGVASALVNTTQEVGGSIGTALLNTIAASAAAAYVMHHGVGSSAAGNVHGYAEAFAIGAGLSGLAIVVVITLVTVRRQDLASKDLGIPVG
jgi:EmrB/QacA subfamily drug resistance transporter